MEFDKPRLARLTAILTHLQSKRLVTANDIATKHGVSIRTVYRDIRTLEHSGIPIITVEGKGYSLLDSYRLPPVMFTEDEANALITAEQIILKNKDQSLSDEYQNAITKVKAVLRGNQKDLTELLSERIQVRNNKDNHKTSDLLIKIQSTITNFQVIQVKYLNLDNHPSERRLEPFALYTTQDNWVLIAYCQTRKDFRAFRLDRIHQMEVTSEIFEPHDMTLEKYLESCRKNWQDTPDIPLTQDDSTFAINQKN